MVDIAIGNAGIADVQRRLLLHVASGVVPGGAIIAVQRN